MRQRLPSSLLSSIPKDESSTSSSTSPVRVVNAAALVHGPAHTAALENARRTSPDEPSTTSDNNSLASPNSSINGNSNTSNNAFTSSLKNSVLLAKNPNHSSSSNATTEEEPKAMPLAPQQQRPPPTTRKTQRTATAKGPVKLIESMDDLLAWMDGSNDGDTAEAAPLTLVLFHAHYCKICQRATMQLAKAAKEYPHVNFCKVESRVIPDPAADNLRSLGVSKFPFVQLYRRGDCVASFSTGPSHMFLRKVRDTLDLCLERDEDCWEGFSNEFSSEIQANRDARSNFRPELLP
jgi:hypothetical protein